MGIVEGARPRHLKASNKPGRVSLVCRIVSLRPFTAPIAFHLGAELVERHPAEPSETWAGRGKKPHWLPAQLKAGKRIDGIRIDLAAAGPPSMFKPPTS